MFGLNHSVPPAQTVTDISKCRRAQPFVNGITRRYRTVIIEFCKIVFPRLARQSLENVLLAAVDARSQQSLTEGIPLASIEAGL
jgi:hypothetical protein